MTQIIKCPFCTFGSVHWTLPDPVRIQKDLAGIYMEDSCKILQDTREKDLYLQDGFYWVSLPFLQYSKDTNL